jgi:16S rRNA (cytosine967-C5)-methyltransferase
MAVQPARRIAFEILRRVETAGAFASDLLHARLDETLDARDRALATELVLGVLRFARLLDFLIERAAARPVAKLDREVRLALRLGLYQLLFLSRVPAHAAVNDSVELVKRAGKASAAALVNAVLRRAPHGPLSPEEIAKLVPEDLPPVERLGILHSHPTWLVERWLARFGESSTIALLEADNRPAPAACAVHPRVERVRVIESLEAAGFAVEPGRLLRQAVVVRGGNLAETEAFRRGWISIQDEASQAVALLLGVAPGERVLDLCAAPGGKTAILAHAAGADGLVVAADRRAHRLRALAGQLRRLGLANVRLIALDGEAPLPFGIRFDRILVDAPCSGTGTLARNPEIRWRLRPKDFTGLAGKQLRLATRAAECVVSTGRFVYATCSLEPEENEQIVAALLERSRGLRPVDAKDTLRQHLAPGVSAETLFDARGFFRAFPPESHSDGFFAAVLERTA